MDGPDFEGARQYALGRLERELPATLCYHSLAHTRDDVVPAAERLAAREGLSGEPLLLLRTAAYFHDIGFVQQCDDHEQIGIGIVQAVLPGFGYAPAQVDQICGMVQATRLPQSPRNRLEELLADADLDVLGRDDYLTRGHDLREEWASLGIHSTDREWYASQLRFQQKHQYYTQAARDLRNAKKQANIEHLIALLASLPQSQGS